MKRFALLKLFPWGFLSGNQVINEITVNTETEAIQQFQVIHPELKLNEKGYSKDGNVSYCIAEYMFN